MTKQNKKIGRPSQKEDFVRLITEKGLSQEEAFTVLKIPREKWAIRRYHWLGRKSDGDIEQANLLAVGALAGDIPAVEVIAGDTPDKQAVIEAMLMSLAGYDIGQFITTDGWLSLFEFKRLSPFARAAVRDVRIEHRKVDGRDQAYISNISFHSRIEAAKVLAEVYKMTGTGGARRSVNIFNSIMKLSGEAAETFILDGEIDGYTL
jgi:hypothetical protein